MFVLELYHACWAVSFVCIMGCLGNGDRRLDMTYPSIHGGVSGVGHRFLSRLGSLVRPYLTTLAAVAALDASCGVTSYWNLELKSFPLSPG